MFGIKIISYEVKGNQHFAAREYHKAIGCYSQALFDDPDSGVLHYKLGNVYAALEGYEQVMIEYKKALFFTPSLSCAEDAKNRIIDQSKYHYQEGLKFFKKGLFHYAIESYNQSLKFIPKQAGCYLEIANSYNKINGCEELELYNLEMVISIGGVQNIADIYYRAGEICSKLGYMDCAIESYRGAIMMDANCCEAYSRIAEILVKQGRCDEALVLYKKAQNIKPDSELICTKIIDLLILVGEEQEALKTCNEILLEHPDFTRVSEQYDHLNINHNQDIETIECAGLAWYFSWFYL
jgi:tetratricopeptide (TPR) repeat protein